MVLNLKAFDEEDIDTGMDFSAFSGVEKIEQVPTNTIALPPAKSMAFPVSYLPPEIAAKNRYAVESVKPDPLTKFAVGEFPVRVQFTTPSQNINLPVRGAIPAAAVAVMRDVIEAIPRAAVTVKKEFEQGSFGLDKEQELPPILASLYGDDMYKNVGADIRERLQRGDGVLSAYTGSISEKAMDVLFPAAVVASGFRVLGSVLKKGGSVAQIEAWKTLGSPATKTEASKNYMNLVRQFTTDPAVPGGGNKLGFNEITKARTILEKEGIPTSQRISQDTAKYLELFGRETQLGKQPLFKLDFGFEPTIQPKPLNVPQLPGYRREPGQPAPIGLSTERVEPVGFGKEGLSTKTLETLKGREKVSKQFISDLSNADDLKQAERDLIRRILADMPNEVSVQEFTNRVKGDLLPLKRNLPRDVQSDSGDFRYENKNLPGEQRGPVYAYSENIYQSPIKTSAGGTHFGSNEPNYFAHTRVEDLPAGEAKVTGKDIGGNPIYDIPTEEGTTRRVIEIQSDLFQKGRLEREQLTDKSILADLEGHLPDEELKELRAMGSRRANLKLKSELTPAERSELDYINDEIEVLNKRVAEISKTRNTELAKLEPYRNTWHERIIREEVKKAAQDGKTKLQFPTGETAMKIEGLGESRYWSALLGDGNMQRLGGPGAELKVGREITEDRGVNDNHLRTWVITDVLGDGKFKALPKSRYDALNKPENLEVWKKEGVNFEQVLKDQLDSETFDISGKVDTNNPIYKFYEKEVGNFLKSKYGADIVTDDRGVKWWQVRVTKEMADQPVLAFGGDIKKITKEVGPRAVKMATPLLTSQTKAIAGSLAEEVSKIKQEVPDVQTADTLPFPTAEGTPSPSTEGAKRPKREGKGTPPALEAINTQSYRNALIPADKKVPVDKPSELIAPTEEQSLQIASEEYDSTFKLNASIREEEMLNENLRSIFADLRGVKSEDLNVTFSEEELLAAQLNYETALESVIDDPARKLGKYVSRSTGRLPEVTGTETIKAPDGSGRDIKNSEFGRRGDEIVQKIYGYESQITTEEARNRFDAFKEKKDRLAEIHKNLREVRDTIRLQKLKNQFIDSSKRLLANKLVKDIKALQALVSAANKAGYKKGVREESKKLADMVARLKDRRTKIKALQHVYGLSDSQMRAIRGTSDPRFMDATEFDSYYSTLETKASLEQKKNEERVIIDAIIQERDLKKTENLRHALELPPVPKMTLEQLFEFDAALSQAAPYDTFLGPRMIQTIQNTDLGSVKTIRELNAALQSDAIEKTGETFAGLPPMTSGSSSKFLYDSALAQKDARYRYIVTLWTAKNIEREIAVHHFKRTINKLAKASRASRKRSVSAQILNRAAPQDRMVVDWLERKADRPGLERNMTPAELEFAKFLDKTFYRYWEIAAQEGAMKKTLLGVAFSRFKGVYFPHSPASFFERWREDGFLRATKGIWQDVTDSRRVDFDAIGPTGEVLGYEKFLKYALKREGEGKYSLNAARVAVSYVSAFEKKLALDAIIPKIDALVFAQARHPAGVKDPTGEGVDGRVKQFIRQWLNNKKGRRTSYFLDQGSKPEAVLLGLKMFVSLWDLGVNLAVGVASIGGNLNANFAGLTTRAFTVGAKRSVTTQGRALLQRYPGVVGEPPFENIIQASQDVGDTLTNFAFILFQEMSYRGRGQFFLGSLTKEEYSSGAVSLNRQAQIKIDMGRFHPIDNTSSVAGSSGEGQIVTMYKKWAVPYLSTSYYNAKSLVSMLRKAEKLSGAERAEAFKKATELLKITLGGVGLYLFVAHMFSADKEDKSFLGKLKRRLALELGSSVSALDLTSWLTARPLDFTLDLTNAIKTLLKLERYKTSGSDYEEGDLKGVNQLQRTLKPAIFRQFQAAPKDTKEAVGGLDFGFGGGDLGIEELDFGFDFGN